MNPGRLLVITALVGVVGGTVLAFWREARDAEEVERLQDAADQLPEVEFVPPQPPADRAGPVKLAALEGLPQYPGANARHLSSGAHQDIAWFSTSDDIEQVLAFYEKEFIAKGKLAVGHQYSPFAGWVGYMDVTDHRLHLISVLRQSEETLVFPSTSWPEKMLDGAAAVPAGLPVVAGAEGGVAFDLGAGGRQVWLGSFANRTPDDLAQAWHAGLQKQGWDVKRSEESGLPKLDARGPAGSLQVGFKRDGPMKVAVSVTLAGGSR